MPVSRAVTLVTGGAGFIGSHLVERLLALGHRVRVVDNLSRGKPENLAAVLGEIEFLRGDLRDEEMCRRAVRGTELVFHVAALPSVPRSLEDPWTSHDCNVNATLRLLITSTAARVRRIVYSSSSSVYGDTAALPKSRVHRAAAALAVRGREARASNTSWRSPARARWKGWRSGTSTYSDRARTRTRRTPR
jgi:nucleoside-diphosphate-sugar epimerase